MSQTFYPIIGIPVPAGEEPPPRRDISSWSTSEDHNDQIQVSLFIRALHKMQERNPVDNPLSYYQLAGVHGYPKAPWDNANVLGGFYCTHGVFTFPTWHRPYMLLYEQVLHSIMVNELVPGIPDEATKKEWTSAAQRWRLPFWDWAIRQSGTGEYGVPQIVQLEQVKVLKLGSKDKESVNNPLYKFTNKIDGQEVSMDDPKMGAQRLRYTDTDDKYASYFNKCIGTSRYADPDQESWVHGSVDNAKVRTAIEHPEGGNWEYGVSIAENVYRILSDDYFQSYETFSSTYFSDEAKKEGKVLKPMEYLSLEMIHNKIHNWTGGAQSPALGHMSDVPVAAFDPIFWLHHCNVDRLFAIWQYLNPDKWFDIPRPVPDPNTVPKPTDALPPFHINKEGKYYSSNDARYCERLGYTYPELLKLNVPHLKANLKNKYGKHLMAIKKPVGDENYLLPGVGDDTFPDYVINVEYDRFALGGNPYTVEFYLVTHNKQSQKSEHHTLGSFYNFTAPVVSDCENCKVQKNSGVKAKAQVPITLPLQGLVRRSYLDDIVSIEKSRVEKLLKHQLVYSVTKMSGEQIPPEDVPGLLVTVHAGDATYPTDDSLHVFKPHTYTPLWGATKDKPRGAAPS